MSGKITEEEKKELKDSLKNLEMKLQESEREMDKTIDTCKIETTQSIKKLKEALEETRKKIRL